MYTKIQLKEPYNQEVVLNQLQLAFPESKVKKAPIGNSLVVRKGFFTTRSVSIQPNIKRNTLNISTNLDMLPFFFLFCWPMALYILVVRSKTIKEMKQKVIDTLENHSEIDRIGTE